MRTLTQLWTALVLALLASGCVTAPPAPLPPSELFSDARFKAPSAPVNPDQLFTLSPAMRDYLHSPKFKTALRIKGPERGLVDALYASGELQLEYDSSLTRNAAQTFDARMGNCMSLVIMTTAFAHALDIPVRYNDVAIDQVWTRSGGLYLANTHVNITLGRTNGNGYVSNGGERALIVDFVPVSDASLIRSHTIDEATIVAMYMNNRAAELLAQQDIDEAYWWARAALERQPAHLNLYNTLGVIYQRHGDLAMAERVYKAALVREPENMHILHNLEPVLAGLGKAQEAKELKERLARLDPNPPFYYFELGHKAMREKRWSDAKSLFAKEVRRSPFSHEFHFWLAMAQLQLGEISAANEQLSRARDTSTTHENTERYSAKLAQLRLLSTRSVH